MRRFFALLAVFAFAGVPNPAIIKKRNGHARGKATTPPLFDSELKSHTDRNGKFIKEVNHYG